MLRRSMLLLLVQLHRLLRARVRRDTLLAGTEPATGLQPDEDVNDPDVILGDEEHEAQGVEMSEEQQQERPRSSASEASEDRAAPSSDSAYDRDCKQCCDTVAACLENGDAHPMATGAVVRRVRL